jgi:hypothetical protein
MMAERKMLCGAIGGFALLAGLLAGCGPEPMAKSVTSEVTTTTTPAPPPAPITTTTTTREEVAPPEHRVTRHAARHRSRDGVMIETIETGETTTTVPPPDVRTSTTRSTTETTTAH